MLASYPAQLEPPIEYLPVGRYGRKSGNLSLSIQCLIIFPVLQPVLPFITDGAHEVRGGEIQCNDKIPDH